MYVYMYVCIYIHIYTHPVYNLFIIIYKLVCYNWNQCEMDYTNSMFYLRLRKIISGA